MGWIIVVRDPDQLWAAVKTAMNLQFVDKVKNFMAIKSVQRFVVYE